MCGITGEFNSDGRPVSIQTIKRMTDIVKHRGPDGEGYWTESFVGFGHRRLAIIDVSPGGHQPMKTDDGALVITYNGEIYNHVSLRAELEREGHVFRSSCDTEVVLKAYQAWGLESLKRLSGMFAFALWDRRKSELVLARDRYGMKPLYYALTKHGLIFGSEIKSLLQHDEFKAKVCEEALSEYFSFQNVFSDLTLFDGVKMLPAGHSMTLCLGDRQAPQPVQYWDFRFQEDRSLNRGECVEELSRLFEQAVQRHLLSDVEVGAYLSGGMDSGSIVALASGAHENLKTFSCGFDLSSASGLELNFDERTRAEKLSYLYQTEQYEAVLKAGDMERVMPSLIWHLEDLRVGQSYPNFYISRLASKFVKVVLSGTGGDELFAGYPWRYYAALPGESREHHEDKLYGTWQRLVPERMKRGFIRPEIYGKLRPGHEKQAFSAVFAGLGALGGSAEDYINRTLYFEAKTFLHGLLVVEDKLSMANSLETRLPFLDNDLVDFALRLRVSFKLKNLAQATNVSAPLGTSGGPLETSDGKLILREALSRHLPTEYTSAQKQGFSAPDASWFKGASIDYVRSLLCDRNARIYDYLGYDSVNELISQHFEQKANQRLLIWSLLCFEWWNKVFVT
jgi:asparagine synthase (glutamine-hydrolysing)